MCIWLCAWAALFWALLHRRCVMLPQTCGEPAKKQQRCINKTWSWSNLGPKAEIQSTSSSRCKLQCNWVEVKLFLGMGRNKRCIFSYVLKKKLRQKRWLYTSWVSSESITSISIPECLNLTIHFLLPAFSFMGHNGIGHPSVTMWEAGAQPGQVARPSRGHTEPNKTNNHSNFHPYLGTI